MGKYGDYNSSFDTVNNELNMTLRLRTYNQNGSSTETINNYTFTGGYRLGWITTAIGTGVNLLLIKESSTNLSVSNSGKRRTYDINGSLISETVISTVPTRTSQNKSLSLLSGRTVNYGGTNYNRYGKIDKWKDSLSALLTNYYNGGSSLYCDSYVLPSFQVTYQSSYEKIDYEISINGNDIFVSDTLTRLLNIDGTGLLIQPTSITFPLEDNTFYISENGVGVDSSYLPNGNNYENTRTYLTYLEALANENMYKQWYRLFNYYNEFAEDILIWLLRDDTSKPIGGDDFFIHWKGTVYKDLTKDKNTKITMKWEQEPNDLYPLDNTVISVYASDSKTYTELFPIETLLGTDSNFTSTYMDIMKSLDPSTWDNIVNKVLDIVNAHSIFVWFKAENNDKDTATAWVEINASGLVSYGVTERDDPQNCDIEIIEDEYNPNDPDPSGGDDKDDDPEDETPPSGNDPSINPHCLLTKTFPVTPGQLQILGAKIWTQGFIDTIFKLNQNPIENIISVKMLPFTMPFDTQENIHLGNFDTEIRSKALPSSYSYRQTLGSIYVSGTYGNFLDIVSTKLTIFIPFIGYKELDTSIFMHKTLKVDLISDVVTGSVKSIVYANNIPVVSYDGTIGIDIPVTSSNRSQVESSFVTGALGVVGGLATGSPLAVVGSGLSMSQSQFHSETHGSSSPVTSFYETLTAFLIYDRPDYYERSGYAHAKGFPCNVTKKVKDLSGFTVIEDIDLSDIPFTEKEKNEIKAMLRSGIYL